MLDVHVSSETLELYSLNRLTGDQRDQLEDHLFLCEACRSRLRETDSYVRAMRSALTRLSRPSLLSQLGEWIASAFRPRGWEFASAGLVAAALLAFVVVVPHGNETAAPGSPVDVNLASSRGLERVAETRAGSTLVLHADVTQFHGSPSESASFRFELVDASGLLRWASSPVPVLPGSTLATATVPKPLPPGDYWVRLYRAGQSDPLLREYPVRLR
jgi:hypothetical protein